MIDAHGWTFSGDSILDTDGDSVGDFYDLDDDNDGILDDVEGSPGPAILSDINIADSENATAELDWGNLTITASNGGQITGFNGTTGYLNIQEGVPGATYNISSDTPLYGVQFLVDNLFLDTVVPANGANSFGNFQLTLSDGSVISNAQFELIDDTIAPNSSIGPFETSPVANSPLEVVTIDGAEYVRSTGNYTTDQSAGRIRFVDPAIGNLGIVDVQFQGGNGGTAVLNAQINLYAESVRDTDGDGVFDRLDLDSDNDGIADNIEAQTTAGYVAPSGVDADGDGLDDAYTGANLVTNGDFESGSAPWSLSGSVSHNDASDDEIIFNGGTATVDGVVEQTITTEIGKQYVLTYDMRVTGVQGHGPGGLRADVLDGATVIGSVQDEHTANGGPGSEQLYSVVFTATSTSTTIRFTDISSGDMSSADVRLDDVAVREIVAPVDTDGDGIADILDLDSDNDGIGDWIEAQDHSSYVGNDGDVRDDDADGDGVIAQFDANDGTTADFGGTFTTPVDSDSDGIADFRDTDSDGDSRLDQDESGLTLAGTDANGDGIDDDPSIGASYADPDGVNNDPENDLATDYRIYANNAPVFSDLDGNPTFIEDGPAVTLDADATVFDHDLSTTDDFGGATLVLERNGGANSEDVFSATGNLVFNAGTLELSSSNIGTVTNTGGTLTLTFAAGTTNAQVNEVMQSIQYANSSDAPPSSVQIDWTFNDGNTGSAQGSGGALEANGSTTVNIVDTPDPADVVVPIAQSVDEDTPLVFSTGNGNAITVDSGSSNDPIVTVTLSVNDGTLDLATTAGITFLDGTSDGDATLTISGTEAAINTALDGLQYQGNQDYNGSDTLTVTTGSDAAVEANLHARYEFLNGSLEDETTNNFDGAANGDPTLTNDAERGDVLTFDGDDRIDVANSVSTLGDEVTIAAWVNLDAGQQDNIFLSIGDEFYIILDNSNPSLSMGLHVNGFTTSSLSSTHNIAGEGWNHVAATFNDITKETYLYLNGELVRSSTFSFSDVDWSTPDSPNITIGSLSDGSNAFTGSLDDVRVYNSELTQSELIAVMGDNG